MVMTASSMLPLGTIAPHFSLPDVVTKKNVSLIDVKSDVATVVMFICNHCPYVLHICDQLVTTIKQYQSKKISFVAISSNDIENYPDDAPEKMALFAAKHRFSFPYLYDESQSIAKAYHAECTPDFFVFDNNLHCVYRGQFDGARPKNDVPVTGQDLRAALDNILSGKPVIADQKPSIGCNIKWK